MRTLVLASVLALAACGSSGGSGEDPCSIATGSLSVSPLSSSIDETKAALSCSGKNAGADLSCSGEATLEKTACDDGFAFVLDSGTARLILRVKSDGSGWTGGAKLENGDTLEGSLSMAGLYDPSTPAPPPSGQKQRAAFALHSSAATLDGSFAVTW